MVSGILAKLSRDDLKKFVWPFKMTFKWFYSKQRLYQLKWKKGSFSASDQIFKFMTTTIDKLICFIFLSKGHNCIHMQICVWHCTSARQNSIHTVRHCHINTLCNWPKEFKAGAYSSLNVSMYLSELSWNYKIFNIKNWLLSLKFKLWHF